MSLKQSETPLTLDTPLDLNSQFAIDLGIKTATWRNTEIVLSVQSKHNNEWIGRMTEC